MGGLLLPASAREEGYTGADFWGAGVAVVLGVYVIKRGKMRQDHFHSLFKKQYGDLPVGGLINPEIVEETDRELVFRCHYNNFELEEDVWYYNFDLVSREFS